ncbi:efflux transporter outer membrane subunit [Massilia sp. TS11]|nr:efflux transporter outer membrane subunit [Massilia sp. TS11]
MIRFRPLAALALPGLLTACAASLPPAPPLPAVSPAAWHSTLPPASAGALASWWEQQSEPLLPELIRAAQEASPDLASARARIAQARAERVAAGAALAPSASLDASATRTRGQNGAPHLSSGLAGLNLAWEIDLFGAGRASRDAAQARLELAEAQWHGSRVALAAETANAYEELRRCWQLQRVAEADAASRAESARLTRLAAAAGLESPANLAMAEASAAEGAGQARAQQTQCAAGVQALAALTAVEAATLRARLQQAGLTQGALGGPQLGGIGLAALPAAVLAQRPDVYAAERAVAAASADAGAAVAAQYPRLGLQGMVAVTRSRAGGVDTRGDTWSIGPLALSLPVFDGGTRYANEQAARAAYAAAVSAYQATVRQAVREVEEALLQLDGTAARAADAQRALDGYQTAFRATEARYRSGMASLFELEQARRAQLGAETALVNLQRERSAAWISLYRAAGGGWSRQP